MANFQDSRFFGFSSRTLWASLAVVGVVIALFFIPEIIKFQFSSGSSSRRVAQRPDTVAKEAVKEKEGVTDTSRAGLSPDGLKELNRSIDDEPARPGSTPSRQKQRLQDVDSGASDNSGLFSGWNMRVKARGTGPTERPAMISLEKLGSREATAFFKRGHADVVKFTDQKQFPRGEAREAALTFADGLDLVGNGIRKNVDTADVAEQLKRLHRVTLHKLIAAGVDRGLLMEWLEIPVVHLLDVESGANSEAQLAARFAPRLILRSLSVRQRPPRPGFFDDKSSAMANAEIVVLGNDVDHISFFIGGEHQRDIKLGRSNSQGFKSIRLRGDAQLVWSLVAYDKYGARPYAKNYSFFPRVRRFRQSSDGTFSIGFKPSSAPNSLDRFFFAGSTRLGGNGRRNSVFNTF